MAKMNLKLVEEQYYEWLEENCRCDLEDDECSCQSLEEYIEDVEYCHFADADQECV